MEIKSKITSFCKEVEKEYRLISDKRKEKLLSLRDYILQKSKENQTPRLVVSCTHNSRRGHIGQVWLAVGADYYQLPEIQTAACADLVDRYITRTFR